MTGGEPGGEGGGARTASLRNLSALRGSRTTTAALDDVWRLWTTAGGVERWWGAEDIRTRVTRLEARTGGAFELEHEYAATASDPARRQEFRASGIATSYTTRALYLEVDPRERILIEGVLDFGPRSKPLPLRVGARFTTEGERVRISVTIESAPTAHWRTLGQANLEGQLDRMVAAL